MVKGASSRREFVKSSAGTNAMTISSSRQAGGTQNGQQSSRQGRIRFAVIGINHSHINNQIQTVVRGGGQLVSFYAKEPDLAAAFAKRFPDARAARSEQEILEDSTVA